jgi:response regulator RpfG family c-di-GMP phosphodiesterase
VDDELPVLEGIRITLRKRFRVTLATSGAEGLAAVRNRGPFAAVLTDMSMPAMDGIGFLTRVKELAPTTVRILLTGVTDLNTAIHVVNDGQIFRFLTKPCPPKLLLNAVQAAVEQHQLLISERVLLEETLRGCIKTLTNLLSISNPAAFGRGTRIKRYARRLAQSLGAENVWEIEMAAMLSQIGCVTLPPQTAEKLYFGQPLNEEEQAKVARLPAVADELLRGVPRLEGVREILALQDRHFDGRGTHPDNLAGEDLPLGARLLKIAIDLDELEAQDVSEDRRLTTMRSREGYYDPKALEALADLAERDVVETRTEELDLSELRPGMILEEDVVTTQKTLLIARGNDVTAELLVHLNNFPEKSIKQPIRVRIPQAD